MCVLDGGCCTTLSFETFTNIKDNIIVDWTCNAKKITAATIIYCGLFLFKDNLGT